MVCLKWVTLFRSLSTDVAYPCCCPYPLRLRPVVAGVVCAGAPRFSDNLGGALTLALVSGLVGGASGSVRGCAAVKAWLFHAVTSGWTSSSWMLA